MEPLKLEVDSKQARADLAAFAKALDTAAAASAHLSQAFATNMAGTSKALSGSMQAMEKFAQVSALMGKIKLSGDPAKHVRDFANALNALSRVKSFDATQITKLKTLTKTLAEVKVPTSAQRITQFLTSVASAMNALGRATAIDPSKVAPIKALAKALDSVKVPAGAEKAVGFLTSLSTALNSLSRAKAIDPAKVAGLGKLAKVVAEMKVPGDAKRLTAFLQAIGAAKAPSAGIVTRLSELMKAMSKFESGSGTRASKSLQTFFATVANIKVPSASAIKRLETLFNTLHSAKEVPNAGKIASDLDRIAAAAGRAGTALNTMPGRVRALSPGFAAGAKSVNEFHGALGKGEAGAARASKGYMSVGHSLGGLSERFKLSYQAGTVFSALFSSFTIGQFLKGVYDTNIALQKLQKALIFSTGSLSGAHEAMNRFIGTSLDLGLNLEKSADSFGRFTLSASASGMGIEDSEKVFKSVAQTLQIVGANSEQASLAFYGLTQMMQKGKVMSEEFNRQIGEQIPGNAVIGARAVDIMNNKPQNTTSTAAFFKLMQQGQLNAAKFVPAWAKAMDEEFGDLKPIMQLRPDVMLNRLVTAFTLFKKTVGESGFMAALGREFDRLTKKFITVGKDGVATLNPQVQKFAETLGHNLADMVRVAGKALEFLVDHLDGVIASLKAVLALKVGATFLSWGQSAATFAGSMLPISGNAMKASESMAADAVTGGMPVAAGLMGGGAARSVAKTAERTAAKDAAVAAASFAPYGPSLRKAGFKSRMGTLADRFVGIRSPGANLLTEAAEAAAPASSFFGGALAGGAVSALDEGIAKRRPRTVGRNPLSVSAPAGALTVANGATALSGFGGMSAGGMAGGALGEAAGVGAAAAEAAAGIAGFETAAKKATNTSKVLKGGLKVLSDASGFTGVKTAAVGAGKFVAEGVGKIATSFKSVSGVAGLMKGALGALPMLATGVGAAFAVAGVALAAFGDKTVALQGKAVKVNDIVGGGFKVLGDQIGAWWEKSGKNIGAFGFKLGDLGKNAGDIVANIVTSFVWLADVIGKVVASMGEQIAHPFKALFTAFDALKSGNIKGAIAAFGDAIVSGVTTLNPLGAGIRLGASVANAVSSTSFDDTKKKVVSAAGQVADQRDQEQNKDTDTQRIMENAAAEVQKRQEALAESQRQAELQRLQNGAALSEAKPVTWDDVFKRFADAGDKTADAATVAAAAASTTAKAADTAAQGVASASRPAANQNVEEALKNASVHTGVSRDLLEAIAYRESSFNPTAVSKDAKGNRVGSASGLFQFTYDTAKRMNLTNATSAEEYKRDPGKAFDAQASAIAAAQLVVENAKLIKKSTGQDATNGQLYGAHFLGGTGMVKLMDAVTKTPDASAADMFAKAAAANPDIFYNGKGKDRKARSVTEVMANLTATAGGQTGAGVSAENALGGIDEIEGKTATEKMIGLNKSINGLLTAADPATAAMAREQEMIDRVSKLKSADEKLVATQKTPTQFTPAVVAALQQVKDKIQQQTADAVNPFSKDQRLGDQANAITGTRLKGLSDEADFREKLNQLDEQGYDITKLDTQANRDAMKALRERTDAIKAALDAQQAFNEARMAGIERTGSATDIAFARAVKPADGQSIDDAIKHMSPEDRAIRDKTASAQVAAQQAGALSDAAGGLTENATASRLSPTARALRDDYHQYLEQISGVTDVSLDRLEERTKKDPGLQDLAKRMAKVKQDIENPPGFQRWADSLEPFAKKLEDIKANFMEGLSSNITDSLYGEKVDWSGFARDISKQVTKAQVDSMLGGFIGKVTGKANLTPEQQATVDAANTLSASAQKAAEDQSKAAVDAGASLVGAADALKSAAQAITQAATGQTPAAAAAAATSAAGTAGGADASLQSVAGAVSSGLAGVSSAVAAAPAAAAATGAATPAAATVAANDDFLAPTGYNAADGSNHVAGLTVGRNTTMGLNDNLSPVDMLSAMTPDSIQAASLPDMSGFQSTASMVAGLPNIDPQTGASAGGGLMSKLGGTAMGLLGILGPLLFPQKKPDPVYAPVNGVIGESRPVDIQATQVAGHGNVIGSLLSLGANAFTGGFGQGGGSSIGKTFANMGSAMSKNTGSIEAGLSKFLGAFSEGGMAGSPVSSVPMSSSINWSSVPHYSEGTHNTSGGMPAMLHPDEAVIPLSRGRSIPVDLGDAGVSSSQQQTVNTNITIVAPNPDSFRQAQGAIQRTTNRNMKRAAVRNLTP